MIIKRPLWQRKKAAAAAAKSHQSCPTLWDPIDGSPPGSHPWDSPGKNTGVGCHFLLQCMKVKSESEVVQSCQTLSDPMDCSPPGSSIHASQPRDRTQVSHIAGRCFNLCATREACGRTRMEPEIKKSRFYQLSECGEFYSGATWDALATVHRSDAAVFRPLSLDHLRGDASKSTILNVWPWTQLLEIQMQTLIT